MKRELQNNAQPQSQHSFSLTTYLGILSSQADLGVEDALDHGTNFVRAQGSKSHLEFVVALRAIAHRLLHLHQMQ